MNRSEAALLLQNASPTTRLRAARYLLDHGSPDELDVLRVARSRETDSWSQRTLDRAILRISTGTREAISGTPLTSEDGIPAVYAEALQMATKRVLHEVRPVLQSIDRAARRDLEARYADGETRVAIQRMVSLLDALQALSEAAESPRLTQFDITELISSQVAMDGFAEGSVILARSDSMLVSGDPALVTLALVNIVRNAAEASLGSGKPVVINWGRSEPSAWISVLDEGEGLPDDGLTAAFEVGTTSRSESGHFGLGLPTAVQAISSLGGTITLRPRRDGGTAAELRWPQ